MGLYVVAWTAERLGPTDDPLDYVTDIEVVEAPSPTLAEKAVVQGVTKEREDFQIVSARCVEGSRILEILAEYFDVEVAI